ncbi:MAG TPA: MerR family transcriptional regulator [Rhodanobacteraceae bacterium]|jgi:MerR family mercuric resistance operon transcriptional regulator|nr:MerR family transcriptional regulator [Rhodanobacteraceae bacterium]
MPLHESVLTIGGVAMEAGVNVETIRFYQRKGLLQEPDRPIRGIRHYGQTDVARVKFIKSAQPLGFSLEEVGQLLHLDDGMQCSAAAQLASKHLANVRMKLRDLNGIEAALTRLLKQRARHRGEVVRPLISALHANTNETRRLRQKRGGTHSSV